MTNSRRRGPERSSWDRARRARAIECRALVLEIWIAASAEGDAKHGEEPKEEMMK